MSELITSRASEQGGHRFSAAALGFFTAWRWRKITRRSSAFARSRLLSPLLAPCYRTATKYLSGWPLGLFRDRGKSTVKGEKRIAYCLWSFPVLSQTFIQREITALMKAGVAVEVFAQNFLDAEYFGDEANRLRKEAHYLEPVDERTLGRYFRLFFRRCPLRLINAFLYVVLCLNVGRKRMSRDVMMFKRIVYLAGRLNERKINHVHAPWASTEAFLAMVAARLLKIPYTVQARAYDIHRRSSARGLEAKLKNAAFVLTNSRYNEAVLRSLLPSRQSIHAIYNGIDLDQFRPVKNGRASDSLKILSVARLVEQKGLEYLIRSCAILKERNYKVSCEIIGGRAQEQINYYIQLQKLRRSLGLEKEVVFIGAQPFERVLEKYNHVDVFVLPAVIASDGSRDVTPNALIEAMAMELPVISSRFGAIPEIIEDGVSGILVPPRDEGALAQALIRLIEDKALRITLGRNARARVMERFDINKNIGKFIAFFESRDGRRAEISPAGSNVKDEPL